MESRSTHYYASTVPMQDARKKTHLFRLLYIFIFLYVSRRKQKDSSNDTCRIVNETLSSNNSDERVETIREGFVIANIKGMAYEASVILNFKT